MLSPKAAALLFGVLLLCLNSQSIAAQTGITVINTTTVAGSATGEYTDFAPSDASGSINTDEEYKIRFGLGNNLYATSYTVNGIADPFNNFVKPDTLIIQRVDNGTQLVIFYEYNSVDNGTTPNEIEINPDIVLDEEGLYLTDLLNAGYDNILVNNSTNFANVERVDAIWYTGIATSTPDNAVLPILDRGGNDNFKVSAITSLDANGVPNGFSTVVSVASSDFATTSPTIPHLSLVMRRQDITSNPLPQTTLGSQEIRGVAISFTELGIAANQTIYGYSIFASDVTATGDDLIDVTNETFYPRNTSNSGLDLIAGISTAVANDNNLRRTTGPGGFKSDLSTWLKANVLDTTGNITTDTDEVLLWDDQWYGNHDAYQATKTGPTFRDGSSSGLEDINFNPTADFDGASSKRLQIDNNDAFNTRDGDTNIPFGLKSMTFAFRTGSNVTTNQVIYEQGGGSMGLNLYIKNNALYAGAWNSISDSRTGVNWGFKSVSTNILTETEYIVTIEYEGKEDYSGTLKVYVNGKSIGSASGIGLLYEHVGNIGIGEVQGATLIDNVEARHENTDQSFYGSLAEMIYCNEPSAFSTLARQQIESYLALKYGITLNQDIATDYVNASGTIIFDTNNPASIGGFLEYNHDIAGIGRDDDSEFEQSASQSENNGSLVRITRKTAIGNDDNWLIWGNDEGVLTETALNTPDTVELRLERIWRASETGEIGVTDVAFDLTDLGHGSNANNFSLLIADSGSSGDFSNAQVINSGTLSTIDGRTFITFSDVNIDNQEYFTLGTQFFTCGPGGIKNNLQLWLRADKGVTTNLNSVEEWLDQYVEGNNASNTFAGGGAASEPTYTANTTNFNPVITFTQANGNYLTIPDDGKTNSGLNPTSQALFVAGSMGGNTENYSSFISKTDSYTWISGWAMARGGDGNHDNEIIYHKGNTDDATEPMAELTFPQGVSSIYSAYTDATNDYLSLNFGTPNSTASLPSAQTTQPIIIGAAINTTNDGVQQFLDGNIGDIIVYDDDLTSEERQQISTYLAIKYGITLDQSSCANAGDYTSCRYLASDGGVVWGAFNNQDYANDIAGIGRDDASCLLQLQSKSINSGSIVTIGLGEIATSNADNPNTFENDIAYLTWGHDGASTEAANNVAYTEGIITQRMERIWRVDEQQATVGATEVSFDLADLGYTGSLNDYQLIISNNADLSSPTIVPSSTFESDVISFRNIDFADGQYFSLATARNVCGPGGITSGLTLWLKADEGTKFNNGDVSNGDIDEWENAINNGNFTEILTGDTDPNKVEAGINYNPYIEFNGVDEDLILDNVDADAIFSDQNNTIFYAFNMATGGDGDVIGGWEADGGGANAERLAYFEKNGSLLRVDLITGDNLIGTENIADRFVVSTALSDATNRTLYINGLLDAQAAAASFTANGERGDFALGSRPGGSNYTLSYGGDMIVFNTNLSTEEIKKVESYLAIKYGVTLDNTGNGTAGDYRGSDNTLLWDASDYSAYHFDVAGIGRDDASCFTQKQATSTDGDDIVTIGLGQIASSNVNNINNFTNDGDYLIWGNNDGSINISDTTSISIPTEIAATMARTWRVKETGAVGNTEVQFDLSSTGFPVLSAEEYRLLIAGSASNGVMSAATIIEGGTLNGSVLSFSNIDLADGEYFTLGMIERCGPGGVNDASLALWLRADEEVYNDAGVTLAGADEDVFQWGDQTSYVRDGLETTLGGASPAEPVLKIGQQNYNPTILFTDPNTTNASYIETINGNDVGGDMTLISVFKTAQTQGNLDNFETTPTLIGAGASGDDDYGLGVYNGRVIFSAEGTNDFTLTSPLTYSDGAAHIATATRVQAASGTVKLYMNSEDVISVNGSNANDLSSATSFGIGNQSGATSSNIAGQFQGDIAETIAFSKVLTNDERTRVESYLAIKYGLTRSVADGDIGTGFDSRDYRNSEGTTLWDYDVQTATFYNDIAGIGRDDNSCLTQLHSKSANDDAIVDIEVASFGTNNAFLVWGNDDAAIEKTRNSERPDNINSRLNREWLAQETGEAGTVTITFDLVNITGTPEGNNDLSALRLMRSTDSDFTTGVSLTSPSSFNNASKTVSFQVNFEAGTGYYFTLGSQEFDALPIKLLYVNAQNESRGVKINWATSSESDNSYFSVERSTNGEIFESIGFVQGAGDFEGIIDYEFVDEQPYQGINYYRLKQVDFSGAYTFSKVVAARFEGHSKLNIELYPNPIGNDKELNIKISGLEENGAILSLINNQGRQLNTIALAKRQQSLLLNLTDIAPGVYFLRVLDERGDIVTKRLLIR